MLHAWQLVITFWAGGAVCFLLVLMVEAKKYPEASQEHAAQIIATVRENPLVLFALLLYVVLWPASIAFNYSWVSEIVERMRRERPAVLPPEPFDLFPESLGFAPVEDPATCELCRHPHANHGTDGCEGCFCHIFVRFGKDPSTCICREWGLPHAGSHHPKCPQVLVPPEAVLVPPEAG